ncbi:hypothetical protein CHELA41_23698 [Hyphomicrobiales bacterium]|nr:hypothetical protein CHELA41_23698 [Hyphomicrobiales bacterium]
MTCYMRSAVLRAYRPVRLRIASPKLDSPPCLHSTFGHSSLDYVAASGTQMLQMRYPYRYWSILALR